MWQQDSPFTISMSIHTQFPAPAPTTLTVPLWNLDHVHGRVCLPMFFFFLLFIHVATAQRNTSPPPPSQYELPRFRVDKPMAIVLVILVVMFFLLGFVSIYTRQCSERRIRGRLELAIPIAGAGSGRRHRGLDPAVVDAFPTFFYSAVKGLKMGRAVLECAVCLSEFLDDETLRLIPKCSHVFHPQCIDVWLATHSTCPVCRANLVPKPGDVAIQIQDSTTYVSEQPDSEDPNGVARVDCITHESPRRQTVNFDDVIGNRPVRSRSTGFGISGLFSRSHSTGHSLVRPGEDCERFTLRLPEDVRNRLVNSAGLNRTTSCGVTLQRESSGRRGYRTRSVGRYERFSRLDRWGFTWTPPFVGRTGSTRLTKPASGVMDEVDVGERSFDRLFHKRIDS